ncbi:MAG TPA: adenylyl-sulfate kinase [Frankiaceae bacterium]|nr:adenylyl-sulfate kinase [Frankiaceae bacterium]
MTDSRRRSTADPLLPGGLLLPADQATVLDREAAGWPELALSARELSGLELRLSLPGVDLGAFDLPAPAGTEVGQQLALRDSEGLLLATLLVDAVDDGRVSGEIRGVRLPSHPDVAALRRTPGALVAELDRRRWSSVHTVVTSRPLFQPDLDRLAAALHRSQVDGIVVALLAGGVEATDLEHHARLAALDAGLSTLPEERVLLTVLPLERAASAEVRRRVAIGYRLAGSEGRTVEVEPAAGSPSDEAVRRVLDSAETGEAAGTPGPQAVLAALRRTHRPRIRQGFTVFFTGLSGSGKSTVAGLLAVRLLELTDRSVLLLDGDRVRRHLTAGLGFSKADRTTNVRRIGWTAAQVSAAGGITVCAPIAPYDSTRREVRTMVEGISPTAGFVLVHIATPLEECERRDRKGLYARARAGELPEFTGISDPYEVPKDAEVVADTTGREPVAVVEQVVQHLREAGYLND